MAVYEGKTKKLLAEACKLVLSIGYACDGIGDYADEYEELSKHIACIEECAKRFMDITKELASEASVCKSC